MKKIISLLLSIVLLVSLNFASVKGAYNYSPLGEVIASAEALIATKVIDSSNLRTENDEKASLVLGTLSDVFSFNDYIYIVDNTNSMIHILNSDYQYVKSFGQGLAPARLNKPQGIFITDNYIYVADTDNFRIAIFNHEGEYEKEINAPDDSTFKQSPDDQTGYDFKPIKVAVDRTGRIYAIADQIFEGIIDFNPDGSFSRYVGANSITLSVWDAFWLQFTSEEQRQNQGYRLATTFSNLNIDDKGYLYTLSGPEEGTKVIKKLNYKGLDVLTRNGYVPLVGDANYLISQDDVPEGPSQLIDIDINEQGYYTVLDSVRGRMFTYDFEGNLLYIGGQIGNISGSTNNQSTLFISPKALCYHQNKILVIDSLNKNLVVFEYTEFGKLVNEATNLYLLGKYDEAKEVWEQVLVLNTNYYLAYAGIGKAQLRAGDYEQAMDNLKLGYDSYNYSQAYQQYRYDQLTKVFPFVMGIIIILMVFAFGKSIKKAVDNEVKEEKDE
ncbi:MAG: hypothetical protein AB7V00_01280 [Bacilli bacterium]